MQNREENEKMVIKILGNTFTISAGVFLVERSQARTQVKLLSPFDNHYKQSPFFVRFIGSYFNKSIFLNFGSALKASFLKNATLSQGDNIKNPINKKLEKNEQSHYLFNKIPDYLIKLFSVSVGATFAALLETGLTNYHAGEKNLQFLGFLNGPLSWNQTFLLFKTGFNIRYVRNGANAFFCYATDDLLHNAFKAHFPKENYGSTSSVFASISSGIAGGIATNFLDVIYKQQIYEYGLRLMHPKEFTEKIPSAYKIAQKLYFEEGLRFAFKGALHNIYICSFAYGTFHFVNKSVDDFYAHHFDLKEFGKFEKLFGKNGAELGMLFGIKFGILMSVKKNAFSHMTKLGFFGAVTGIVIGYGVGREIGNQKDLEEKTYPTKRH